MTPELIVKPSHSDGYLTTINMKHQYHSAYQLANF